MTARLLHLCRLGLDGKVPDHSTFSKNRHGRFRESDLLRHMFESSFNAAWERGWWAPMDLRSTQGATLEWVDWFNNRRLLEPIGNIPPAEAEERYYAMLNEPAMAA